eukprot:SAG31_NODE_2870_length_4974_cov_1.507282_4_plen_82_part_00
MAATAKPASSGRNCDVQAGERHCSHIFRYRVHVLRSHPRNTPQMIIAVSGHDRGGVVRPYSSTGYLLENFSKFTNTVLVTT